VRAWRGFSVDRREPCDTLARPFVRERNGREGGAWIRTWLRD
jgi:hypothetical protein